MDLTESPPARGARLPGVLPVAAGVGALAALAAVWLLTGPGLLLLAACIVSGYGLTHLSALPFTVEERFAYGTVLGSMAVALASFGLVLAFGFGLVTVAAGAVVAVGAGAAGAFTGRARQLEELADLKARWLGSVLLSVVHPK